MRVLLLPTRGRHHLARGVTLLSDKFKTRSPVHNDRKGSMPYMCETAQDSYWASLRPSERVET